MRLRRVIAVAGVIGVSVLAPARPSAAAPIFEAADATELANKLAEATEDQDVCYGWIVVVNDQGGGGSGTDTGSSLGPDVPPTGLECVNHVVFTASITYTSEFSESVDTASFRVETSLPGFDATDLSILGIDNNDLIGENVDTAVFNATSMLPLLVAEQGLAPPVVAEQTTGTIPAADKPTGRGGSDRIRTYLGLYLFAAFVVLSGLIWLVLALYLKKQERQPRFVLSDTFDDH